MAAALRTDRLPAEGAVFNGLRDTVGAVTVVKRAHDHKLCFAAAGARFFIDNVVTGVALVPAFVNGDIFKRRVFFFETELFRRPVHRDLLNNQQDKIMGIAISKISDLSVDGWWVYSPGFCVIHCPQRAVERKAPHPIARFRHRYQPAETACIKIGIASGLNGCCPQGSHWAETACIKIGNASGDS
jgi:hypothetical protein